MSSATLARPRRDSAAAFHEQVGLSSHFEEGAVTDDGR